VLLFAPGRQFLRVRLAQGNDRIRRFFHEEAGDIGQINLTKRLLEHRVESESPAIRTLGELEHFLSRFANELLFTPPRAVRVENPEVDLMQLYEDLVGGGRVRRDPPIEPQFLETLRQQIETAELPKRSVARPRSPCLSSARN